MTATIALLDPARSRRTIAKATERASAPRSIGSGRFVLSPRTSDGLHTDVVAARAAKQ